MNDVDLKSRILYQVQLILIYDRQTFYIITLSSNLDSSLCEVYKYTLDGSKIESTVDQYTNNSIELDYENYSNLDGWDVF